MAYLLPASTPTNKTDICLRPKRGKKRADAVRVACDPCRSLKAKCSGKRPSCERCVQRKLDCIYVSINESETHPAARQREYERVKHENVLHSDLLALLQRVPPKLSVAVMERLRQVSNLSLMLQSIQELLDTHPSADILGSEAMTLDEVKPEDSMSRQTSQMHIVASLQAPSYSDYVAPRDGTVICDMTGQFHDDAGMPSAKQQSQIFATNVPFPDNFNHQSHYSHSSPARSQHPVMYLSALNCSLWTEIRVDNQSAARAIEGYFGSNHISVGMFDFNSFVIDLVDGGLKYCSQFVFCALLAYAMQSSLYQEQEVFASEADTENWQETYDTSYRFEEQAQNLWKHSQPRPPDSCLTLIGLVLLYFSLSLRSNNALALAYLDEAWTMGSRMRLFNTQQPITALELTSLSEVEQRATLKVIGVAYPIIVQARNAAGFGSC